jgi:poly(A) polymerase
MRFLGHAREGADIVSDIMGRLRFSAREQAMVGKMVAHHLRPGQMVGEGLPTRRAIYRYFRDTGDAGIDTIFLNLADHLAARGPQLDVEEWREHAQQMAYVMEERFREEGVVLPPRLIDGHDLIDIMGLIPGPKIGGLLEAVREAQAAGEVATREEALSYVRERICS